MATATQEPRVGTESAEARIEQALALSHARLAERSQRQADAAGHEEHGTQRGTGEKGVVGRRHPVEQHALLVELYRSDDAGDPAAAA